MENESSQLGYSSNDEFESIDLISLLKKLWSGRLVIFITVCLGILIGIVIAVIKPNEYTANAVIVPQMGANSAKSSLSSLASLAGFDLGSMSQNTGDISPLLYPQIINSIPFKLELMSTKIQFSDVDTSISFYDYYTTKKEQSFSDKVFAFITNKLNNDHNVSKNRKSISCDQPLKLTKKQAGIKKILDNSLVLNVEKKDGYITLSTTLEDPMAAAEITEKAQLMLQKYITKFKIEKSQAELDFIQERYAIAKSQAESNQVSVAASSDRYKDLVSNVPQVSNERLQTKYSISNSVYLELAKQLEQAKIQVKKDTPTFTIIEPTSIPLEKSSISKLKIIALSIIFSFIIGCIGVLSKTYIKTFILIWNK